MTSTNTLANRVAVVTGSSRGIGAGIARLFAQQGAKVALHGRDTAALAAVKKEIAQGGGTAIAVPADATSWTEIEEMRRRIEGELGPVEILVANAGGNPTAPGPIEEMSEEAWRAGVDANLTATFLSIKSVLPGMKQRRAGNIITISSAAARRPTVRSPAAYAAAKAGIELLTQMVAIQAGPFNVRANCIAPETILTERNQQLIPSAQQTALVDQHPLKRLGTPEDVARAALFLASDAAGWISATVLDVAGGSVVVR
ncbi:MAG TPA: SDR family NAD(P)-dependent oxidoreductase [Polyangia bacterium]|jgi:3-oxoacyl-[acyl-carrier protein] reductase|nr:SDR family NAD(P)-dependent oxidoreductase [Polyangia bacterium]